MRAGSRVGAHGAAGRLSLRSLPWVVVVALPLAVAALGSFSSRPGQSRSSFLDWNAEPLGRVEIVGASSADHRSESPQVQRPRAASNAGAVLQDAWIAAPSWPLAAALGAILALALIASLAWRSHRLKRDLAALKDEMSRRTAAEAERQREEGFYRAHYNNTTDSIFVIKVEADGRFTTVHRNPAHAASFGGEDILGKELYDFLPPDDAEYAVSYYRQCVETRGPIRYVIYFGAEQSVLFDAEKGHQCWETVLAPVFDETGKITHVIGTSREITERIRLEERLRQSQKMEALGQLTGGIAHDFNNLLTVVMGNLDLLKRAREIQRSKLIHNALQAVERARDLTLKLLAFARRQPLRPEPTDVKALIVGMDDMLMQSLRGDIALELELADDLCPVEVDQAQLQVALINLAVNARDAMPRGGTLTVKAENARESEDQPFDRVAISVSDTGHGMSEDVLERAFNPFFTTKEVGRGTGLGLAQVYGFAQQSGGTVEIKSEVGSGTTVTLYLPRCQLPVRAADRRAVERNGRRRPLRLLLVEDNVQVAEVAASILEEHGHTVTTVHGADQALAMLDESQGFDLVFSDLVMPGERDGLDLARTVRTRWPTLPVLLATGYSEAGGRAAKEGFPLLAKPYRASSLVSTIERVSAESESGRVRTNAP
jgi:PAS domain S-box-containing protein